MVWLRGKYTYRKNWNWRAMVDYIGDLPHAYYPPSGILEVEVRSYAEARRVLSVTDADCPVCTEWTVYKCQCCGKNDATTTDENF